MLNGRSLVIGPERPEGLVQVPRLRRRHGGTGRVRRAGALHMQRPAPAPLLPQLGREPVLLVQVVVRVDAGHGAGRGGDLRLVRAHGDRGSGVARLLVVVRGTTLHVVCAAVAAARRGQRDLDLLPAAAGGDGGAVPDRSALHVVVPAVRVVGRVPLLLVKLAFEAALAVAVAAGGRGGAVDAVATGDEVAVLEGGAAGRGKLHERPRDLVAVVRPRSHVGGSRRQGLSVI